MFHIIRLPWHKIVLTLVSIPVVVINVLAWRHARAMTHFVSPDEMIDPEQPMTPAQQRQLILSGIPVVRPENDSTPADSGYDYEVHTITLPNDEWLEAWYLPHPQPHGIALLFHGYAASKVNVIPAAEVLHTLGYSPFVVDTRGSGGSSGSTTTLGVREAQDVVYAATYVRNTWPQQPLILYGTSMGAVASLRAVAREGVEANAIIAEVPFARLTNGVRAHLRQMGVATFPTTELLVLWGGIQHGFNAFAHNPVDYARNIHIPTLLLRGSADVQVTEEEVRTIFAALPGPKQRIDVPDVGHDALLPHTPKEQIAQFLSEMVSVQ